MVSDDEPPQRRDRPATIPPVPGERAGNGEPGQAAGAGSGVHDELPETIRHRLERLVPELVRKTFAAGLGAVFSTEEGIRKIARESLPDAVGYIASSADGAKDKVFEVIARETREFLSNLNVSEEIAKILTTLSFEIKTEIRFIPNSDRFVGAEPEVKASVRLKRQDGDKGEKADRKDDRKDDEREGRSRLRFWQRDKDGDADEGDPERPDGRAEPSRDRKS
ncbi:MAG TPA: hypothetical protein VHT91_30715 [Kofleriaceae bacterium]|jgi:hypothetical protein|nr:hypothetical protein [Kofleriaceae bacterium]